jgi:hypothetical protein
MSLEIHPQPTPNPNAMKFNLSRPMPGEGSRTFDRPEQAADNPLAQALLGIDGVTSVFMLRDFITLSKDPEADWEVIVPKAVEAMQQELS